MSETEIDYEKTFHNAAAVAQDPRMEPTLVHLEVGSRPFCCAPVDYAIALLDPNLEKVTCKRCKDDWWRERC